MASPSRPTDSKAPEPGLQVVVKICPPIVIHMLLAEILEWEFFSAKNRAWYRVIHVILILLVSSHVSCQSQNPLISLSSGTPWRSGSAASMGNAWHSLEANCPDSAPWALPFRCILRWRIVRYLSWIYWICMFVICIYIKRIHPFAQPDSQECVHKNSKSTLAQLP